MSYCSVQPRPLAGQHDSPKAALTVYLSVRSRSCQTRAWHKSINTACCKLPCFCCHVKAGHISTHGQAQVVSFFFTDVTWRTGSKAVAAAHVNKRFRFLWVPGHVYRTGSIFGGTFRLGKVKLCESAQVFFAWKLATRTQKRASLLWFHAKDSHGSRKA